MNWLKPGLPAKTLREIRATNTISAQLRDQLHQLNEETAFVLQTLTVPQEPTEIQKVFQDFYVMVGQGTLTKGFKFPEVKIEKLRAVAEMLDTTSVANESDRALVHLVDRYLVVLAAHELASLLIFKTIVLKQQINYWGDVKLLTYGKVCFGIQTLPHRIYDFGARGVHNTVFLAQAEEGIYERLKSALEALWSTFSKMGSQVFAHLNRNFVLRGSRLRFLKVPLSFIDAEIKDKISAVQHRLDTHYGHLGLFINNLPVDLVLMAKLLGCEASRSAVLEGVERKIKDDSEYKDTRAPGLLTRYWPLIALLVQFGPSTTSSIYQNRFAIADWIRLNLVDTMVGFWKNWVVKPVWDMLAILRADDSMAIASKESLQSDLNSLERMVTDFMRDNNIAVDSAQVHQAVSQGDLTVMMSQYEKEIKTPYKLIILGQLIRSILIQIQKTKVDGAMAISGIDKLLKLQQLLFGMLSVLPLLFILYQANQALRKDTAISSKKTRIECLKSLNLVAALVNRESHEDKLISDGKLFVEIVNLTLLLKKCIPARLHDDWLADLNGLMVTSAEDGDLAARAVERIWNMYLPFFRRGVD